MAAAAAAGEDGVRWSRSPRRRPSSSIAFLPLSTAVTGGSRKSQQTIMRRRRGEQRSKEPKETVALTVERSRLAGGGAAAATAVRPEQQLHDPPVHRRVVHHQHPHRLRPHPLRSHPHTRSSRRSSSNGPRALAAVLAVGVFERGGIATPSPRRPRATRRREKKRERRRRETRGGWGPRACGGIRGCVVGPGKCFPLDLVVGAGNPPPLYPLRLL